jgi:acetyl esterase/lipase
MRPTIYRYGSDASQFGELWLPESSDPAAGNTAAGNTAAGAAARGVVVVIHGGFWRARYGLEYGRPLAQDLARRGYAAWNLEYRRSLAGGGWPATFEDVAAGIDRLATLPALTTAAVPLRTPGLAAARLDISRVVAIGHSAGGHLAVWAAGRPALPDGAPGSNPEVRLTGVISQAGVLALTDCAREHTGGTAALDLMGGTPEDLPSEYRLADPMRSVPLDVPVVCLHSRADDEVPFGYSERYAGAATAAGADACLIETDGDHYTLIDPAADDWRTAVTALPALLA